jgi:hypothetical protein
VKGACTYRILIRDGTVMRCRRDVGSLVVVEWRPGIWGRKVTNRTTRPAHFLARAFLSPAAGARATADLLQELSARSPDQGSASQHIALVCSLAAAGLGAVSWGSNWGVHEIISFTLSFRLA